MTGTFEKNAAVNSAADSDIFLSYPVGPMPEVLSPCGSLESLEAALKTGADAVYAGAKRFSARHNAKNFDREELALAVRLCHRYGAKLYQAVNTCVLDRELSDLAGEIKYACEIGVDGLIIQDRAAEYIARTACPEMHIHASTQMTIHSENGVMWARENGYCRVVLARELPEDVIRELSRLGIQTEVFVHGALCMSCSGQCYLSAMIGSRSANRGLCAGACRLPFSADGKPRDKYSLSLKDLSLVDSVKALWDAGVSSLKIEGRMKRPEYVAAATHAVRLALEGMAFDSDLLRAVFSRSGFTNSYFTGRLGAKMFGARSREDAMDAPAALPQLRQLYRKDEARFELDLSFCAAAGKDCTLTAKDGISAVSVSCPPPEKAVNRATSREDVYAQLSKLGSTFYRLKSIDIALEDGLMIPLSRLNSLRRDALEALDCERILRLGVKKRFDGAALRLKFDKPVRRSPKLWVSAQKISALKELPTNEIEKIIIPLDAWEEYLKEGYPVKNAVLSLPRFTFDEKSVISELERAMRSGFTCAECQNPAHIRIALGLGASAVGGFGLNITNSVSANMYAGEGLSALTLSFELKASQLADISCPAPAGAIIYGRLPLMLTVNCPIKAEHEGKGVREACRVCTRSLTDRTGAKFPVLCKKQLGYYELLNSKILYLADKLDDFSLDYGILYFTTESAVQARKIYIEYIDGAAHKRALPQDGCTRGLYYRGII